MGACIRAVVVRTEKRGQILLYLLECIPPPYPTPAFYPFSPTHYSDLRFSGMPSLPPDQGRFPYYTIA